MQECKNEQGKNFFDSWLKADLSRIEEISGKTLEVKKVIHTKGDDFHYVFPWFKSEDGAQCYGYIDANETEDNLSKEKFKKDYQTMTYEQLAMKYCISRSTVRNLVKELGLSKPVGRKRKLL